MNQSDMMEMKLKMNIRYPNSGFTIVELLVAMVITLFALGAIYSTFLNQHKSYVVQEETATMNQNLRIAMFYMEREIRMAGCDPTGNANARVLKASATSINFTEDVKGDLEGSDSDGDTDDANENITYCLKANNLVKNTGGGNQMVVQNIDALDFVYLDGSSPPNVLNPGGSNVPEKSLDQIRSVEVTMVARTDRITLASKNNNAYFNQRGWQILEPQNDNFSRRRLTVWIRCRNLGF
ncbi:MAG: prepilin-type N-terminal cleavage/methylation domain-containing protein [Deltaproteobacteria bacterium]|jgi:type IV pilus assembly protein PilW|nr:prepilin-type N-terminal cleavage/methylation domain-containing protein [Deltaproteobacteria bacterium]